MRSPSIKYHIRDGTVLFSVGHFGLWFGKLWKMPCSGWCLPDHREGWVRLSGNDRQSASFCSSQSWECIVLSNTIPPYSTIGLDCRWRRWRRLERSSKARLHQEHCHVRDWWRCRESLQEVLEQHHCCCLRRSQTWVGMRCWWLMMCSCSWTPPNMSSIKRIVLMSLSSIAPILSVFEPLSALEVALGPAETLYTSDFYKTMKTALRPGGIICTQVWRSRAAVTKRIGWVSVAPLEPHWEGHEGRCQPLRYRQLRLLHHSNLSLWSNRFHYWLPRQRYFPRS